MKIDVVSYSSSFAKRTVCKYCKTGPIIRYVSYESFCVKEYKQIRDFVFKYFDKFNPDYLYLVDPRDDLDIKSYNFSNPFPLNVRLHKNMKYSPSVKRVFEKIDVACCECNKTVWLFNMSYPESIGKVDVSCRKSHKKFSINF